MQKLGDIWESAVDVGQGVPGADQAGGGLRCQEPGCPSVRAESLAGVRGAAPHDADSAVRHPEAEVEQQDGAHDKPLGGSVVLSEVDDLRDVVRCELERDDLTAAAALGVTRPCGRDEVGSPAGPGGPTGEIDLLGVEEERFVEQANTIEHLAAHQPAGALCPVHAHGGTAVRRQGQAAVASVEQVWQEARKLEVAPGDGERRKERIAGEDGPAVGVLEARRHDAGIWQAFQCLPQRRYRRLTLAPAGRAPVRVDWAQGACWLIRRELLDEVGLLDEDFFLYAEEIDLARRAARSGWRTYLVPTARARHAEGSSSSQVVPLKLASHYLSKVVYFGKHHGTAEQAAVRAILLLDLGLRMAYRAIGVVRGRPPDARQRLVAYARTARLLATQPTPGLIRAWHALAHGEGSGC